jgi:hypothetical protein
MDFDFIENAKEKPDVEPILIDRHPSPYDKNTRHLIKGTDTYKAYELLINNPDNAYTTGEMSQIIGTPIATTCVDNIFKKGFIFKSKIKIPTGKTFNSAGYIFSYSEKAIWKRFVELIPEHVKQALFIILKNPNMIFCIKDLQQLSGIDYGDTYSWFDKIFIKAFSNIFGKAMLQKKCIEGLRTFYYHPDMPEEKFQELYKRYYEKQILSQESLSKLKGKYFEEFATWTFIEYMKLKGLNLDLKKVDREPCDYIANMKINIGDLMVRDSGKEINVVQFVISCKNWDLDRCVSGNYVLGMSGAMSRGMTFNCEQLFTPCRSVGVIICIKANYKAWKVSINQGILIVDLLKLMRMYQVVNQTTGQTHPYYERIAMKVDAYESDKKGLKY